MLTTALPVSLAVEVTNMVHVVQHDQVNIDLLLAISTITDDESTVTHWWRWLVDTCSLLVAGMFRGPPSWRGGRPGW